jgi:hypothetical protein
VKVKATIVGLAVVALVAVGLAIFFGTRGTPAVPTSAAAEKNTFTISGSIKIPNNFGGSIAYEGNQCHGGGGYSDLTPGAAVTVSDSAGAIVGTGSLHAGTRADMTTLSAGPELGLKGGPVVASCTVSFTVTDVPDGLPQYVVSVSHRGSQVVSAAEAHGEVLFTLR